MRHATLALTAFALACCAAPSSAQAWSLLPDGYVVGVHVDELRTAYAYRLTQDERVSGCALRLAATEAALKASEETAAGLRETAAQARTLAERLGADLDTERKARAKAERKVRNRTPWARFGQGTAAVGAVVLAIEAVRTITNLDDR